METNTIYEGDNREVLSKFPDKSVDLIYLDPPFFSNRYYEVIWQDGAEIRSFEDRWKGGVEHYIQWMETSLRHCHRILKDSGSLYLHCDWHANAHLRILLDEIFGSKNFLNEIIWCYKGPSSPKMSMFGRKHDSIFWYSKGKKHIWNVDDVRFEYAPSSISAFKSASKFGGERTKFINQKKYPEDWWVDIPSLKNTGERLGYPTQKPVVLLERIIKASSNKGDIVLDLFCGCGTTLAAAQNLERKWIGIDVSPTACKLMKNRIWKNYKIKTKIVRGFFDFESVAGMNPREFQNWVVVEKFSGQCSKTMSNDGGIDGRTSALSGSLPIQVKQSKNVGRNVVDNFETAIRRDGKSKGFIVAYSFSRGANEEVARAKRKDGLDIKLISVRELLEDKTNGGFWK